MIPVVFEFHTGVRHPLFTKATLQGSWDSAGAYSVVWSRHPMREVVNPDGSRTWIATVEFQPQLVGRELEWGVRVDGDAGTDVWAIAAEAQDWRSQERTRRFVLKVDGKGNGQPQSYYLTHLSHLGANVLGSGSSSPVRFAVWAPNAQRVSLVIGDERVGYIDNTGKGVVARHAMTSVGGGVWETTVKLERPLDTVYMFELVDDSGAKRYRTDLYSRCQAGSGDVDPERQPCPGNPLTLDGRVSLSYVMDPSRVESPIGSNSLVPAEEFWADEFNPGRPVPRRLEDLVIYELHVGALAYGQDRPGNIGDAIALLPYLEELGVNAVELLPLAEYSGGSGWGYGSTHFCAVEFSCGGPDHLKAFVKACHQRGIAVIMDVVYNHYPPQAERAQWMYDTTSHSRNPYYWYEGREKDYSFPEGGYIDNQSSGWAPAFHSEMVRGLFISSAVSLVLDFHVDGFRVDQTTSIHSYPALHANGEAADQARIFGAKFLREWTRTLRLVKPDVMLTAEDHSSWPAVTQSSTNGGLGFDATWFNDFYHHLIGDTGRNPNLLASAGCGGNWPLAMDHFAGLLARTNRTTVVPVETHDERGNSAKDGVSSTSTLLTAVHASDPAQLVDGIRGYAEARTRVAAGLTLLSAGVPLFFMGEEIGAMKPYRYDDWLNFREDLWGMKSGVGSRLFAFYSDIIRLRRRLPALRSSQLDVLHAHNENRIIAFKRWGDHSEALVLASLSNSPFPVGYTIHHAHLPDARWREVHNSDSSRYGGLNYGNCGGVLTSSNGSLTAVVPANGLIVLEREA